MKWFVPVLILALVAPLHAQEPTPEPTIPLSLVNQLLAAKQVPPASADYTPILQQLVTLVQQQAATDAKMLDLEMQMLAIEKDTNAQVNVVSKTFGQTLADVATFVGKYIAPAVLAYGTAKHWF